MYADDTSLCVPRRDAAEIKQKVNHDLSSPNDWFIVNKRNLSTVKSEFMIISGSHHLMDPNLRSLNTLCQLKPVSCRKHLGVEIESRLFWLNHIGKICKKVSSGIGIVERARPFVNLNTLDMLYKLLEQCHFDYRGPVWDTVGKTLSEKL